MKCVSPLLMHRLNVTYIYNGSNVDSSMIYSYCFCREVSRDRDREKKRDQEDEEEAYERRKLERKLRDKEAAYQEVGNAGRTPGLCQRQFRNQDGSLIS